MNEENTTNDEDILSDEELEAQVRKEMQPFVEHQDTCQDCAFFPLSMPCYEGAKLLNPELPDRTEAEYLHRMEEGHKNCEWCHGNG